MMTEADTLKDLQKMANEVYDSLYHSCANCGDRDKELKSCAQCRAAKYCSKACQAAAWMRGHKEHCHIMGKLAASLFKII